VKPLLALQGLVCRVFDVTSVRAMIGMGEAGAVRKAQGAAGFLMPGEEPHYADA
jgi:hypothetical protein